MAAFRSSSIIRISSDFFLSVAVCLKPSTTGSASRIERTNHTSRIMILDCFTLSKSEIPSLYYLRRNVSKKSAHSCWNSKKNLTNVDFLKYFGHFQMIRKSSFGNSMLIGFAHF